MPARSAPRSSSEARPPAFSTADPSGAFALSRLDNRSMAHVPIGVFRSVARPTYDDQVRAQVGSAVEGAGGRASDADLSALLDGSDTWTV